MKKIEFSNGNTFGTMLVDKEWYDKHKEVNDNYQLYLLAENDENSKMQLVFILDSGVATTDVVITH